MSVTLSYLGVEILQNHVHGQNCPDFAIISIFLLNYLHPAPSVIIYTAQTLLHYRGRH
jgi:hypothetical protein